MINNYHAGSVKLRENNCCYTLNYQDVSDNNVLLSLFCLQLSSIMNFWPGFCATLARSWLFLSNLMLNDCTDYIPFLM